MNCLVHGRDLTSIRALRTFEEFLSLRLYVPNESNRAEVMRPFTILRRPTASLTQKGKEMRRLSLRADLLEKRSHASGINFADVMPPIFVLFLRGLRSGQREKTVVSRNITLRHSASQRPLPGLCQKRIQSIFLKGSRAALGWTAKKR